MDRIRQGKCKEKGIDTVKLQQLVEWVKDKSRFANIDDYSSFCEEYLSFVFDGLQAVIVSRNENHYRFFQYKDDGFFNVSRPINSNLLISIENYKNTKEIFEYALRYIREIADEREIRLTINRFVYTCQQSIGAALDALPASESNTARKINGDLFERYIRLIISGIGIHVRNGIVSVPVVVDDETLFQ